MITKKLFHDVDLEMSSPKAKSVVGWVSNLSNANKIYGTYRRSTGISARLSAPNTKQPPVVKKVEATTQTVRIVGETTIDVATLSEAICAGSKAHHDVQHHARRLAQLQRVKDRLKGQYLHFDIPSGLDDTTARFIMAVALRYSPGESTLHGNFELSTEKKEHHRKCLQFAEPVIQYLHSKGYVFIRQLLPSGRMNEILCSANLGVTEEFFILSNSLLNVLRQMDGSNHMSRTYLMSQCDRLMETHTKMKGISSSAVVASRSENGNLVSFLNEYGTGGDDFDDDDHPGGLWKHSSKSGNKQQPSRPAPKRNGSKRKSWVVSYTEKILSENDTQNPAYAMYRDKKHISLNES